jgi:hypothetical protein
MNHQKFQDTFLHFFTCIYWIDNDKLFSRNGGRTHRHCVLHFLSFLFGAVLNDFSLSLSWCVERKILIPPLHLVNREPSSLTLFQKRELVTELVRRRTITEQAYIQIEFYTAERGGGWRRRRGDVEEAEGVAKEMAPGMWIWKQKEW